MNEINIKQDKEYLHEIMTKLEKGVYTIPSFQRSYVWREGQILDLFDSISKSYPIGSILLWQPNADSNYIDSRDILTDKVLPQKDSEYFILDGRQRLTTFYGCLNYEEWKSNRLFNIGYNLEKDSFEYINKPAINIIHVADLFDTFRLLERLQDIKEKFADDNDRCKLYINRARKMNAKLQAYQIGETLIGNCNLDEASTVFSRINSKGTDISKVSMFQAVFFNEGNKVLLSDRIDQIINNISPYGFDGIKPEDILNCCYKYVGLNFYDANKETKIERLDFTSHLDEIEQDVIRTAKFLNEECMVISHKLLPYFKQFIAISTFFKEVKEPTDEQLAELKKWFFYTTVNQSFMNGSLSNVRPLFRRFDDFVQGRELQAEDYLPIDPDNLSFDFRFSYSSALSDFLILSQIYHYKKYNPEEKLIFLGCYKHLSNSPEGIIPYLSRDSQNCIFNTMKCHCYDAGSIHCFALTKEMLAEGNTKEDFIVQRRSLLKQIEMDFIKSMGLSVKSDLQEQQLSSSDTATCLV